MFLKDIRAKLYNTWFDNDFLDVAPKAQGTKKTKQTGFHQNWKLLWIER